MKIHEYQAKELLKKFGVAVPQGVLALNGDEAVAGAKNIGFPIVVKAQIHAGGRGKGGGIKLAKTPEETKTFAGQILGMTLVTPQTGSEGKLVKKVWIEKATDIAKEFYLGLVLDRACSELVLMASPEGGVEIEEVANRSPEKIFKTWINPTTGLEPFQARKLGFQLGLDNNTVKKFASFAMNLYRFFMATDASMAEINPLVLTKQGDVLALDAKVNFDDNALFRHPDIAELLDPNEEDKDELEASVHDLNYISLSGNIGCLVNGAGLAMATMDIIKLAGGAPCNFLDVGGSASQETVTEAFRILLRHEKIKVIFVNIFGGILKCDLLAEGIVAAAKELDVTVPLVVRLLGTNVEEGKKILVASGLNIISEDDMTKAAQKVVACAKESI
ncbi:MAG: ADP-forming succinate--CoA ligase subunit beta [Deltaproteobacteria bacterium]|nr:ADP-forming succinate--CoA ligase subunit beta [Deltaproteobacteria bacterium]